MGEQYSPTCQGGWCTIGRQCEHRRQQLYHNRPVHDCWHFPTLLHCSCRHESDHRRTVREALGRSFKEKNTWKPQHKTLESSRWRPDCSCSVLPSGSGVSCVQDVVPPGDPSCSASMASLSSSPGSSCPTLFWRSPP